MANWLVPSTREERDAWARQIAETFNLSPSKPDLNSADWDTYRNLSGKHWTATESRYLKPALRRLWKQEAIVEQTFETIRKELNAWIDEAHTDHLVDSGPALIIFATRLRRLCGDLETIGSNICNLVVEDTRKSTDAGSHMDRVLLCHKEGEYHPHEWRDDNWRCQGCDNVFGRI